MQMTYENVMEVLSEYLPDAPISRADGFVRALLEEVMGENNAQAGFLEASKNGEAYKFLTDFVSHDEEIIGMLAEGKKIQAIKVVRIKTLCGLKEAVDAVESAQVLQAVNKIMDAKEEAVG